MTNCVDALFLLLGVFLERWWHQSPKIFQDYELVWLVFLGRGWLEPRLCLAGGIPWPLRTLSSFSSTRPHHGLGATAFRLVERKSKVNHPKNFPNVSKCDVWSYHWSGRMLNLFEDGYGKTQQPEAFELRWGSTPVVTILGSEVAKKSAMGFSNGSCLGISRYFPMVLRPWWTAGGAAQWTNGRGVLVSCQVPFCRRGVGSIVDEEFTCKILKSKWLASRDLWPLLNQYTHKHILIYIYAIVYAYIYMYISVSV